MTVSTFLFGGPCDSYLRHCPSLHKIYLYGILFKFHDNKIPCFSLEYFGSYFYRTTYIKVRPLLITDVEPELKEYLSQSPTVSIFQGISLLEDGEDYP